MATTIPKRLRDRLRYLNECRQRREPADLDELVRVVGVEPDEVLRTVGVEPDSVEATTRRVVLHGDENQWRCYVLRQLAHRVYMQRRATRRMNTQRTRGAGKKGV